MRRPAATAVRRRGMRRVVFGVHASGYQGGLRGTPTLSEWAPGIGSADADTILDLSTLRARSRDLGRNAPLVAGALQTHLDSTIGIGLQARASLDTEVLGLSEEEADAWERRADRIWQLWAHSPSCDLTRRLPFAGQQRLALRSMFESGDVFGVRRFVPRPGDPFGTRVQLVEADRCTNPNYAPDTDRLVSGVEKDENGAPVAYHFMNRHPGDMFLWAGAFEWTRMPAYGPRSGMPIVLHIGELLRPQQTRSVPLLAPVIEMLKQLSRYTDAELQAAVVNSLFTVFITTEHGDGIPGLSPLAASESGAEKPEEIRLGSGMIADLAAGEDVKFADPKRPNQQFDQFIRALANQIGVAIGLPFELLIKHFTSSYSASRAALLEAWRGFFTRRHWFVRSFCQPIRGWVLTEAVARGMLTAPGFFDDPLVRQAWLGTLWTGPTQGQIDPLAEVQAATLRVDQGFSTVEEETAQLTGGDWERNHRQRVKERSWRVRDQLEPAEAAARSSGAREAVPPSQREGPTAPAPPPPPLDQSGE